MIHYAHCVSNILCSYNFFRISYSRVSSKSRGRCSCRSTIAIYIETCTNLNKSNITFTCSILINRNTSARSCYINCFNININFIFYTLCKKWFFNISCCSSIIWVSSSYFYNFFIIYIVCKIIARTISSCLILIFIWFMTSIFNKGFTIISNTGRKNFNKWSKAVLFCSCCK